MSKFKSVGGPKKYFKYAECKKGELLVEGKFLGRTPNKFGKENFDFKPEEGGPTVCLNHAGQLAYLIENNVREGDLVQVIYDGKGILEKGAFKGKEVHNFQVNIADTGEQLTPAPEVKDAPVGTTVDLSNLD